MKTLTTLLIGCSLIVTGVAIAQQPEEQPTAAAKAQAPEKGKHHEPAEKPEAAPADGAKAREAAPASEHGKRNERATPNEHANAAGESTNAAAATPAERQHGGKHANDAAKGANPEATPKAEATPKVGATPKAVATPKAETQPSAATTPAGKNRDQKQGQEKAPAATPSPSATAAATTTPAPTNATATPAATAAATTSAAPSASAAAASTPVATPKPNTAAATKKPDQQKVQQIKSQFASFRAQPNPQIAPPVTFNPSYRVEGSDRWQGAQYEAFRSYHPERHDEGYYQSRYSHVELIGGGYYYENNGYWYPAWGYSPQHEYYAYDGPIYVGQRAEPPDRVIADVQAELKDMGYYKGNVDGLLGPLTRQALRGYQDDAGLTVTAAIDAPTLDALNLNS